MQTSLVSGPPRFISLWFDNAESEAVNGLVSGLVADIPSHKFVGLLYQLAARMSDQVSEVSATTFTPCTFI